ncbi:MAG: Rrf2 family transcriptional regulator [Myxococcales bacterium]
MSGTNVQFAVAAHIMAALGFHHGEPVSSAELAQSVNANPSFVRKSLSKLAKAGLIETSRGKGGASTLVRSPKQITMLDIYRASQPPPAFALHDYPVMKSCAISSSIKGCMSGVLDKAQQSFERTLSGITLADMIADIRRRSR